MPYTPVERRPRPLGRLLKILLVVGLAAFIANRTGFLSFGRTKGIKGTFMDGVYVPAEDGPGRLWFRTDGSFYYILRTQTPGRLSMATKSIFNKVYTYVYDPVSKKVIQKTRQKYPTTPPRLKMFFLRDLIWFVNSTPGSNSEANIEAVDPKTGQQVLNFSSFLEKFPQLSPGIAELIIRDQQDSPYHLRIKTKDGRDIIYDFGADAVFESDREYRVFIGRGHPRDIFGFFLSGSSNRKELLMGDGPKSQATAVTPGKVYLDGHLLYGDKDIAIIVHQTEIGKGAQRLLSGVNAEGKILWTLPQTQLFPKFAIKASDPFSTIFFMKSKVHGQRAGNVFVLIMERTGMMGIDLPTGNILWTLTAT